MRFTQADKVHGALEAGAAGYLLKDAEADEVAPAIRAGIAPAPTASWQPSRPARWSFVPQSRVVYPTHQRAGCRTLRHGCDQLVEKRSGAGDRAERRGAAPRLRVLLVDDDARVRRALRSLIECAPDLTVVGEAGSTQNATRLDLELDPDVVVLDLLLPRASDGLDVLGQLRRRNRPVVAISGMGEWDPRPFGQARTPSWTSTAATWMTSST